MFYPEVTKIGGSLGVIVPKNIVELINLRSKDKVQINLKVIRRNIIGEQQ